MGHLCGARQVNDQRVIARAAFGGEDLSDGGGIVRISAQAIHGLGGQTDQAARAQAVCRCGHGLRCFTVDDHTQHLSSASRTTLWLARPHRRPMRQWFEAQQLAGLQGRGLHIRHGFAGDVQVAHLAARARFGFAIQM